MATRTMLKSWFFRPVAFLIVTSMTASIGASGIEIAGDFARLSLAKLIGQIVGPPRANHYSGPITPAPVGTNPGRDPNRHVWTPERRLALRLSTAEHNLRRGNNLFVALDPLGMLQDNDGGGNGGGGTPGEGGHNTGRNGNGTGAPPGGGPSTGGGPTGSGSGTVGGGGYGGSNGLGGGGNGGGPSAGFSGMANTATGNKLTNLPIVSWPTRGDLSVDFCLYHNSIGNVTSEFGDQWTHTYELWLQTTSTTEKQLHFPDGTVLPYTLSSGTFYPAFGSYGKIVPGTGGTADFYSHSQMKYHFDANGDLESIADRSGNSISITRDSGGKILTVSDSYGSRTLTFNYTSGKVSSIVGPGGRTWSFTYASQGGIDVLTYPMINSTSYTMDFNYDAADNLTSLVDRRGNTWNYEYDTTDRITREMYPPTGTNPPNYIKKYTYTSTYTDIEIPGSTTGTKQAYRHNFSAGNLVSVVDPIGFHIDYEYDTAHNIKKVTDALGNAWNYTYDSQGNVLTAKNPNLKTWTYTYNSSNDLLTVTDPASKVLTITRLTNGKPDTVTNQLAVVVADYGVDSYGQVNSVKDAYSRETTISYNANGDVSSVDPPNATATTFTYDSYGQLATRTNGNSINEATIDYDAWGRAYKLTHPDTTYVQLTFDPENNVTAIRDENNHTSNMTYNNAGHLTQVQNARGDTESYVWDANTWMSQVTNGRGYTRTYDRGLRGDIVKLTMPDGAIEQWTYNGSGDVTKYTSPLATPNNYDIEYVYDAVGRLTTIDYDTGTDTTFGYDDLNRRTSMVDSTGTTSWTFNDASQLTALSTPQGSTAYEYWNDGQRKKLTNTGVGDTTYAYSSTTGQLTSFTNAYTETTSFVYDSLGRLDKKTLNPGQYEKYTYDTLNRVTNIDLKNSSNTVLLAQSYSFDNASNILTHTKGSTTTTYTYDAIDQLLSESRTGYSASYTYDANGNRLTKTLNGTTEDYTTDSGDKLTTIKVGSTTTKSFVYDAAGRTKEITYSGVTSYLTYDYESRLTQISRSGTTTNTFAYNGLDTRISKVDSAGTATYKRDGVGVTAPVLSDGSAVYTPGISERRGSTTTFEHSGVKSLEAQSGTGQTIAATKTYDAFGNLDSSTGTWNGPFSYGGGYGYQQDADYGLKLLGHRYYDSSTGRFLTRDPARDGRTWYAYCSNNPIKLGDPSGLIPWPDYGVYTQFINTSDHDIWVVGDWGTMNGRIIGGPGSGTIIIPPGKRSPWYFDVDGAVVNGIYYEPSNWFMPGMLSTVGHDGAPHAESWFDSWVSEPPNADRLVCLQNIMSLADFYQNHGLGSDFSHGSTTSLPTPIRFTMGSHTPIYE